jgi:hypothetical protein
LGIRKTNWGMNSVVMIAANRRFRPGKSIRASAYAAIDAVTSTRTVCAEAATMLLRNHRRTGV